MGRGLLDPQSAGDSSRWIRVYAPRELRNRRHSRWQLLIRLDHGSIGHSVANADREPYVQCGLTCCAYAQRLSILPKRFLTSLSSGAATDNHAAAAVLQPDLAVSDQPSVRRCGPQGMFTTSAFERRSHSAT